MGKMGEIAADISALGIADFDLTRLMKIHGVKRVEQRRCGVFTVELFNDCIGSAPTVGEALAKAQAPDAVRLV